MQIKVTARHLEIPDALREYLENKAEKLTRFHDRISSIDVVLEPEADKISVEMIAKVAGVHEEFVAKELAAEAATGADLVSEKLERQLTRHKEKQRDHRS